MKTAALNRDQLTLLLREIATETFKIPIEKISPQANLKTDLDLDSIDMFDILALIEQRLGCSLPNEKFRSVTTVDEFLDVLESCGIE